MSEVLLMEQDTLKLYEYEGQKPELDDVLAHHGILGQRWGQRNGPPYPLDSKVSTGKRLKKEGSISRKRKKALKKARKTRAKNLKFKTEQKAQEQQRQKTKEEILKTKDVKAMLNNVEIFTTNEINDMLNRISSEKRLQEEVARQAEANKNFGRKLLDTAAKNTKEAAANMASQAIRKGTEVVAKKAISELTKEASPETRKAIDTIFNIERPKEATTAEPKSPLPDAKNLQKVVDNIGSYKTKDLQEMVGRINTENTIRKMLEEEKAKKKK